ncbi:MAG: SWIM zinc finger family protein, partial [Gemmatimonadota bacterium]
MQRAVWPVLDHTYLETAAGPSSYARGVEYLRQRAVQRMWWEPAETLHGRVRGSGGQTYSTTAYFSGGDGEPLVFSEGHCSCPVGFDCKHVVALVLAAASVDPAGAGARPGSQPAGWEQSLQSLLGPADSAAPGPKAPTPLAIELTLAGAGYQTAAPPRG